VCPFKTAAPLHEVSMQKISSSNSSNLTISSALLAACCGRGNSDKLAASQ
jgi:hypothetical protein